MDKEMWFLAAVAIMVFMMLGIGIGVFSASRPLKEFILVAWIMPLGVGVFFFVVMAIATITRWLIGD